MREKRKSEDQGAGEPNPSRAVPPPGTLFAEALSPNEQSLESSIVHTIDISCYDCENCVFIKEERGISTSESHLWSVRKLIFSNGKPVAFSMQQNERAVFDSQHRKMFLSGIFAARRFQGQGYTWKGRARS
jgi:hypothetical protein